MPEWPRHINQEMRQHLDDRYRALRAGGVPHDDAMRRLAGDVDELSSMRARPVDRRHRRRALRAAAPSARTPASPRSSSLTLALGIGATPAIFSVVDAVMLRPYPYPDIDRIMILSEVTRSGQGMSVAWPNFQDWRDQNQVVRALRHLPRHGRQPHRRRSARAAERRLASSGVFDAVGIQAQVGRDVRAGRRPARRAAHRRDQRPALAHAFQRGPGRRRPVDHAERRAAHVVGVMPAGMRFPSRLTDVWLPLGLYVQSFPAARRASGPDASSASSSRASAFDARGRHGRDRAPPRAAVPAVQYRPRGVAMIPYYEQIVQNIRPTLLVLLGAVGFVLLIACANLANLMLARADAPAARDRDPRALGASRWRIAQQLLTESVLLALGGGALGVLLASWAVKAFVASLPTSIPRHRSGRRRSARAGVRGGRLDRDRHRLRPGAGAARLVAPIC